MYNCVLEIIRFIRFIRILFDAIYVLNVRLFDDSSLLRKCRWTEVNCRGAELGVYDQSVSFSSVSNPYGNPEIQTFSRIFKSFIVSSVDVYFIIYSIYSIHNFVKHYVQVP